MDEAARLYPARRDVPWDDVEGRVAIVVPRHQSPFERWLQARIPMARNAVLSLEGAAADVWRLSDGTRTLADVAASLPRAQAGGGDVAARVLRLARDLERRGFLALHAAPRPVVETLRGLPEAQGFRRQACRKCRRVTPLRAEPGAWWLCPACRRPNRLPRA